MSKFVDVGKKSGSTETMPVSSEKNEKYYPSIHLDVVPDSLESADVGHECTIQCKVVVRSKSTNDSESGKSKNMSLEVRAIAYEDSEADSNGSEMKRQYKAMKGMDEGEE